MVTKITTNRIKKGTLEAYIEASKAFENALVQRTSCISAKVYTVDGNDTIVVNIETWPDTESANTSHLTDVFQEYLPQLVPYFEGNEGMVLYEA